ncbi:MAG: hypothetical protein K9L60_04355 [Methylovulum sp.]|jgi:chromosome segregation ATPase|nr:hypothetical protein [Methylovulum sp.]MCF7998469.1 hypothetical protein [Methylovulum sp.]
MVTFSNPIKNPVIFAIVLSFSLLDSVTAAPRDNGGGNAKIVNKLQSMVKDITSERDQIKAENGKLTTEIESLKAQVSQEKETSAALEGSLNAELSAEKASKEELQNRVEATTAKLREVVDKYNALNKSKNDLSVAHTTLQSTQQVTASELKQCESKNIKMFEGAKEIIEGYHHCQNKDIVDTLIDSEPFSQIKNVEFETIIQDYEDKILKQKYHTNAAAESAIKANAEAQAKEVKMPLGLDEPSVPAPKPAPAVVAKPAVVKK